MARDAVVRRTEETRLPPGPSAGVPAGDQGGDGACDANEHQTENAGKSGGQNVLEPAVPEALTGGGESLARGAGGRDRGHESSLRDRGPWCIGPPNDSAPIHIHPREGGARRDSISGWRRLAKRAVMVPPMSSDSEGW